MRALEPPALTFIADTDPTAARVSRGITKHQRVAQDGAAEGIGSSA